MSRDAENTPMGSRDEQEPLPAHDQADIDAMNQPRLDTLIFENFPRQGSEIGFRSAIFGPATRKVNLLVTVDPYEGRVDVVLGNGPTNDEAPEATVELMEMVIELLRDPQFVQHWAASVEQARIEEDKPEVATESISFDDLLGDDETQED